MEHSQIIEALNWRYATKKFDSSRKISESDWKVLEESLHMAPSSFGLQPWKFLIVQNPAVRKQLTPASWNQTQIEDCSHLVVVTTLRKMTVEHIQHLVDETAKTRGLEASALSTYRDMMVNSLTQGQAAEFSNFWTQRAGLHCYGVFT